MVGVFITFAAVEAINLGQFGVGLVVAMLLDAKLVRLVLLPAVIRLAAATAGACRGC